MEDAQTPFFFGTLEMPMAHDDPRRTIFELNFAGCSVQGFRVKASKLPLGNHFHTSKDETFVIIKGGGRVYLREHVNDPKQTPVYREDAIVAGGPPIYVSRGTAHAFVLEPGSEMICISSAPFDPKNPDMVAHKVTY